MKNPYIVPSIIFVVGIILTTFIFVFKNEIKTFISGPNIDNVKNKYGITDYNIDSKLYETYEVLRMTLNSSKMISFEEFKKSFYSLNSFFGCIKLDQDLIFLPKDQLNNAIIEFPSAEIMVLCIYKRDTMLVNKNLVNKLKKELPKICIID